jgi:arylsulfatase A-like enzyme
MSKTPNILLVTADHLRYDTLGCTGDPVIQTPAIDSLASGGVSFSRAFAQNPVCQPSRASIMTGRYPRHHGVRWNGDRINENETTLVEFFKSRGYTTASIGKHHISQDRFTKALDHCDASGIRRNWTERPDGRYEVRDPNPFEDYVRSRGFEYRTGYALPDFRKRLGAVPSELPEECHLDSYVGMRASRYLDHIDRGKPFFLWLGFYGPHHPYVPSGRFARMYDPDRMPPFRRSEDDIAKKPVEYRLYFETENHKYRGFAEASDRTFREMKAAYYGMVSQLDRQLGLVLEKLEERGLAGETMVVFTSDHGEFLGDHGLPAKAPFLLDCMLHVPLIVRLPERAGREAGARSSPAGSVCDDLVESVDIFPTAATLAGFEAPPWVQGRDLGGLVADGNQDGHSAREAVYAEAVDKKCIRTDRWKYIHYPGKTYGELYDLERDPHELDNLHDSEKDLRLEMQGRFYRMLDATEDFRHPTYQRFEGPDPRTGENLTHYHTW